MRTSSQHPVRVATLALLLAVLAACGSSDDGASSSSSASAPATGASGEAGASADENDPSTGSEVNASGDGDGITAAVVVLNGVTYQFAGGPGDCKGVSGGLIAGMDLTQIDGVEAPDGAGSFSMSLYPAGLEDESQISVKVPDGRFNAGSNDLGLTWPDVTVTYEGLSAIGEQELTSLSGEKFTTTIRVECS